MKSSIGVLASWANVTFSFAAFGLGLTILGRGGSADADAITVGVPLLVTAEALKILIGVTRAAQVAALGRVTGGMLPRLAGAACAVLMIVAGTMGVAATLSPQFRGLGAFVNPVALSGVVATGLWALASVIASRKAHRFPAWMAFIGALLPLTGIAALFIPAAGLAAFIVGVLWNIGVGAMLGKDERR